jgi:predicted  nucleic acid-binding Zn-ribbon protein
MGRPPVGKTAMTAAERMRRYRLKHAAAKPAAKPGADTAAATIAALRKELAAAKAGVSNAAASPDHAALVQELKAAKARIEDLLDEIAALKAELHDTIAASSRFASKPAKPKVEKPPLPPDEAL